MGTRPSTNHAHPDLFDPTKFGDMGNEFSELGQHVIGSKIQENALLAQSQMDGGPNTIQEALKNKLERTGMGMRALALKVGIGRKPLLSMLEGRVDIPADTLLKIIDVLDTNLIKPKKTRYG